MAGSPWSEFFKATKDQPHTPLLERAVGLTEHPGAALDLGCGAGRDTRYLLLGGWNVTAVDREPEAIAMLAHLPQHNLTIVQSSFEDFACPPASYDLISAMYSLPFIPPASFRAVFERLRAGLRQGGLLAGQLFGPNDEWNTPDSGMTFASREQVDELLGGLRVRELTEEENDGGTATGGNKHWHVFHFIAQQVF